MSTDSFVVKPLRFPGGSIGELAVNGTVNDLAMAGARPAALSLSLILEEGLPADELRAEVEAIARGGRGGRRRGRHRRHQGRRARALPTGCTSAPPGSAGSTSAPSSRPARSSPATGSSSRARSASTAPRSCSPAASSSSSPQSSSDTRSLWPAADALIDAAGDGLRCMRDATRGGVASALNELARASEVAMLVREGDVPVHPAVAGAAEMLGIDPMYIANEGKFVAFVAPERSDAALAALREVEGCDGRRRDRRGEDGAAGDGPGGDRLRRQAGDGHARRRPPAEDLLILLRDATST